MLTLPDFKEKQILFIEGDSKLGYSLKFSNDNLVYYKGTKRENQISCYKLLAIFLIGDFTLSTVLLRKLEDYGISIFLLKNNFHVYCFFNQGLGGNYLLRIKQYKEDRDIAIAKLILTNKIVNQLNLLEKYNKINFRNNKLEEIKEKIKNASNIKILLGLEGSFSKIYFSSLFEEEKFNWKGRQPRIKQDVNNLLLDIGYSFLFNFVDTLLNLFGFDTYKGFYHQSFFKRQSLSCDIMEPFRCFIDETIYLLYKNKVVDINDFYYKDGSFQIKNESRRKYCKIFLEKILENKVDIFCFIRDFYYFILHSKKNFNYYIFK